MVWLRQAVNTQFGAPLARMAGIQPMAMQNGAIMPMVTAWVRLRKNICWVRYSKWVCSTT